MSDFFEVTTAWYEQVSKWPQTIVIRLLKLGDKVLKLLGLGAS